MARLRLAKVLKKKGWSKYRLAKVMNVPQPHVYRLFREGYDPRLSTLERIAKALGCKIRDLIDE